MVLNIVSLELNVPELIWTIINFFLLFFLLKIFLFNPILKFMKARKEKIDEGMNAGKKAQAELEANQIRLTEELSASNGEARDILTDARVKAEQAKSLVVADAHAQVTQIHKDLQEQISDEETKARASIEKEMPDMVAILTNQLLHSEEASKNKDLIDSCMQKQE